MKISKIILSSLFLLVLLSLMTIVNKTLAPIKVVQTLAKSGVTNQVNHQFAENFSQNFTLEESDSSKNSNNPNWWLNSGAYFYSQDGIGRTIYGDFLPGSKWYEEYKKSDPTDTDGGRHPQNIFRLVTKGEWKNLRQEVYFNISKDNLSQSDQRYASNGVFLMNRYTDGNNLYYAGLRVDGTAVIKKKINGVYYTLDQKKVFAGEYDRNNNPSLLPHGSWIGIRSEVTTVNSNSVKISLFEDVGGGWKLVAEATDSGSAGIGVLNQTGYAGIRTDFMDVSFDNYSIADIPSR